MSGEQISNLFTNPQELGHLLGYRRLKPIHGEWITKMISSTHNYGLLAHRGSYKSSCLVIAIVLFTLLYPNKTIAVARKTEKDCQNTIAEIRKHLLSNDIKYISSAVYKKPLELTKDSALVLNTNYKTKPTKEGSITGVYSRANVTGQHYDKIFFDDITGMKDMVSQSERQNTNMVVTELLVNILNEGGTHVWISTPWHKKDASTLVDIHDIVSCYDSKLMTKAQVEEKRNNLSPSQFSVNYLLRHSTDEFYLGDIIYGDIKQEEYRLALIDKSFGGKDTTALTLIGRNNIGKLLVKGKIYSKVEGNYQDIDRQTRGLTIYTEDNDDKLKAFSRDFPIGKVSYYRETENKALKISTHLYSNRDNLIFSRETDDEYIEQIQNYTTGKDKGLDDCADSLASAIRQLLRTNEMKATYVSSTEDPLDATNEQEDEEELPISAIRQQVANKYIAIRNVSSY